VCESLKNVKGFNYFCAVDEEDIRKYVFETFDFGFFPSAEDLHISISSEDLKKIKVFGAPDSEDVASYNGNFEHPQTSFTISKVKTVFPSELEIHKEVVYTVGGLILIKLKRKGEASFFKGEVQLKYRTPKGQVFEQNYPVFYEFHPTEQFFSEESLRHAIEGYVFTSEMRALITASKDLKEEKIFEEFSPVLKDIKEIVPESKVKEYESIKKIVEGYGNKKKPI
jgi:hypothetical protein